LLTFVALSESRQLVAFLTLRIRVHGTMLQTADAHRRVMRRIVMLLTATSTLGSDRPFPSVRCKFMKLTARKLSLAFGAGEGCWFHVAKIAAVVGGVSRFLYLVNTNLM
jgi:hypothetical protein